MPTYDYECEGCQHQFEAHQKISEEPMKTCPKCQEDKVKRLISGKGSFSLAGSGWFKTGGY
jgi:putative FmdB family regulatory protein